MSIKRTLCSLVAAAAIGLSGCGKEAPKTIQEETLRGTPINAEAAVAYHTARLSVMIEREDGKYILCNAAEYDGANWWHGNVQEGKTIIQSEIDDKDNEPISLRGKYNGDRFEFTSISANGYTVDAKRK